jgi:hypothetical protein
VSEGQAILFTPGGPVAFPADSKVMSIVPDEDPEKMSGASVHRYVNTEKAPAEHMAAPVPQALPIAISVAQPQGIPITSPGAVLKAAKARAQQIRAELRNKKTLEKELAELERLIAAAKGKPIAVVRNIDHARHAR